MTWGWQDVAVGLLVASAALFLARKYVPGSGRKGGGGCASGGCPSCPLNAATGVRSCQDKPIEIGTTRMT